MGCKVGYKGGMIRRETGAGHKGSVMTEIVIHLPSLAIGAVGVFVFIALAVVIAISMNLH